MAAIFDVDGTLLDSMSVWEDIGERYLASQNITAEKNLRAALHTMSLEQGAAWMKEKYQLDKSISQIIEEVLILYLLKWCLGLFLTMLPCIAASLQLSHGKHPLWK